MLTEFFVYSLPLVTMGISGPTVATLVLFTALHPVSGGDGQGSGATVSPNSASFWCFLYRYDPSRSTNGTPSRIVSFTL